MINRPLVSSLVGMTIACPEPTQLVDLVTNGLGWDVFARGNIDETMRRRWGIDDDGAGDAFWVLRSASAERGMIRVVSGGERKRTRPLAARWAGVEILVTRDIDALFERLKRHAAFTPTHSPFNTDWSEFGSNVHRAFIGRGPGGTHLAFTMAITQPKDRAFPSSASVVGHVFDVPLITGAYDRARQFYRHTLGMIPILESQFDRGQWHDLWALPQGAPVVLDILKGDAPGTGWGGIEMQGYDARLIDPEPASVNRFDAGACMITYTTRDIEAACEAVAGCGVCHLLSRPASVGAPPYRGGRAFSFLGPDGERFEICDSPWQA